MKSLLTRITTEYFTLTTTKDVVWEIVRGDKLINEDGDTVHFVEVSEHEVTFTIEGISSKQTVSRKDNWTNFRSRL